MYTALINALLYLSNNLSLAYYAERHRCIPRISANSLPWERKPDARYHDFDQSKLSLSGVSSSIHLILFSSFLQYTKGGKILCEAETGEGKPFLTTQCAILTFLMT